MLVLCIDNNPDQNSKNNIPKIELNGVYSVIEEKQIMGKVGTVNCYKLAGLPDNHWVQTYRFIPLEEASYISFSKILETSTICSN